MSLPDTWVSDGRLLRQTTSAHLVGLDPVYHSNPLWKRVNIVLGKGPFVLGPRKNRPTFDSLPLPGSDLTYLAAESQVPAISTISTRDLDLLEKGPTWQLQL